MSVMPWMNISWNAACIQSLQWYWQLNCHLTYSKQWTLWLSCYYSWKHSPILNYMMVVMSWFPLITISIIVNVAFFHPVLTLPIDNALLVACCILNFCTHPWFLSFLSTESTLLPLSNTTNTLVSNHVHSISEATQFITGINRVSYNAGIHTQAQVIQDYEWKSQKMTTKKEPI